MAGGSFLVVAGEKNPVNVALWHIVSLQFLDICQTSLVGDNASGVHSVIEPGVHSSNLGL